MRLLVYNIAYGTGAPPSLYKHLSTVHRYIRTPQSHLEQIIDFIEKVDPDVIGLIEVDIGSYRTHFVNQVELIANHLKRYHHSSVKYSQNHVGRMLPILRKQANAILTKKKMDGKNFYFFHRGFKKLIIEADIEGVHFFLVHLALQKRVRTLQLKHLVDIVGGKSPVIIAGDFNTFSGMKEIREFQKKLGLVNPNKENLPTFPSWQPNKQVDFFLCSKTIEVSRLKIPHVKFSDHLPLILDFDINRSEHLSLMQQQAG